MIVMSCNNISKSYIIEKILVDVTFAINDTEKVGLVGLNGAGKTTLFKILTNQISMDSGNMYISKDCKIGYLEQNSQISSNKTVFEEALDIFTPLINMESKLRNLEKQISAESNNPDSKLLQSLMHEYGKLSEEFSNKNGYGYQSEIKGVLKGLGFSDSQFNQPVNQLSGGQKTRLVLSKLLLKKPNILLLDEPTNHLDLQAIDWLEKYIKDYKGAALIISHDRQFLDATVDKIFHLEHGKIKTYNGNYTTYMKKRKAELQLLQKKFTEQQKEIERQKEIINRFMSYGGKRYIRQAQSRQKFLDKIDKVKRPPSDSKRAKIRFEPKIKSGNDILSVDNIKKSFDNKGIFENISFNIYKGEKTGIIGPNGVGKSTLFKIIMKKLKPSAGSIDIGHNVHIGYYDQELTHLNPDKTIIDEIWDENPKLDHYQIRTLLAQFLFYGDDIFKEIGELSGGEKSRISLLKLMLSKSNFLLMDEPTNHLDIESKEVLEDALINYQGTLLVISHDRYFLNKVTNKILEMNKDGMEEYLGNYNYYLEKKNSITIEDDEAPQMTKTQLKAAKKRERELIREKKKMKQAIKTLESEIASKEEKLKEIDNLMCQPDIYSNPEESVKLHKKSMNIKKDLDDLYEKWMDINE